VRKEIEKCLIERSFLEDSISVVHVHLRAWWYQWPPLPKLALILGQNKVFIRDMTRLYVICDYLCRRGGMSV